MIKNFLTMLLASLSLFTATAAQANSAQALSLGSTPAVTRAASEADGNELVGTTAWFLAAIGAGLAIWGIVEIADSDSP